MSYKTSIPGQVSEFQLRAIETVASLVPEHGTMVEIGSLFGRSSYAWGASVPPSASVHCIDPWEGNKGVHFMEVRHGISYGLDQFMAYTGDCPNIIARRGYSPRDFKDWSEPIDLFYEDSVHKNPVLQQNLDFWSAHLKTTGVACGDDYRPRFEDVVNGVHLLAKRMGRELIVIDKFWCLLPPADQVPAAADVRARLLAIQEEAEAVALAAPDAHSFTIKFEQAEVVKGSPVCLEVHACNNSPNPWLGTDGMPLSAHVSLRIKADGGGAGTATSLPLPTPLTPDCPVNDLMSISTKGLEPGTYHLSAQLILTDQEGAVRKQLSTSQPKNFVVRTATEQCAPDIGPAMASR